MLDNKQKLIRFIQNKFKDKLGIILLISNFEQERYKFIQESSFYYFTGITEPGVVNVIDSNKSSILFIPEYSQPRNKWAYSSVYGKSIDSLNGFEIDRVESLGSSCQGYSIELDCDLDNYKNLISYLKNTIKKNQVIFTPFKDKRYKDQRIILERLMRHIPELKDMIVDISDVIGEIRRTKSKKEIENIYKAINVTILAHKAAIGIIAAGKKECEVQAGIDFIFADSGAQAAFPSIVSSGKNSTILHYNENNSTIPKDSVIIVDIGARVNHYCADISRTYSSGGKFTKRQLEVYNIVKDVQSYIADLVKPGYWIKNSQIPEKSLQHLAVKYLEKQGYGKYLTHGIGHYLGLDVHDVGSYLEPLQENDVITIEPGIYIPEENIGIRIEDNYWILEDKALNLSEDLSKDPIEIEKIKSVKFDE